MITQALRQDILYKLYDAISMSVTLLGGALRTQSGV